MAETPEPRGPRRGESDVELSVHEEEDDDQVEYLPESKEVRYVGGYHHTKPPNELEPGEAPEREPSFSTTPAERWGTTQCLDIAVRAAADHVAETLDSEDISWCVTSRTEGFDRAALVDVTTVVRRDGTVGHAPDVDFDAVVEVTPRTVSASYELGGFEYELDVPIHVRHSVVRNQ